MEVPPDSGAGKPGVLWFPTTEDPVTATRSFARTGHWDGIARPNYETITGQRVVKVVLSDSNAATGVVFVPSDATALDPAAARTVRARREVVVAAGTIHSPQILQNSGIGAEGPARRGQHQPEGRLAGVGHNFQDHPFGAGASYVCE